MTKFVSSSKDLLKQWNFSKNVDLNPDLISQGSHKKVWWVCEKEHNWETSIRDRFNKGYGCPYCSNRLVSPENNLFVLFPNIAKEWHPYKNKPLKPDQVIAGTHKKVWWKCTKGHQWEASVASRSGRGQGCGECSNLNKGARRRLASINKHGSLLDLNPELAKQWHDKKNKPLLSSEVALKSGIKVWWKCNRGHEWQALVSNRSNGSDCPFCSGQTSKLEIRAYTELSWIFNNVIWRTKIDGIEIDIYLKDYKIGIELDGFIWHKNKDNKDKSKNTKLNKKGITIFRLRDSKLEKISNRDVFYINGKSMLEPLKLLLKGIIKLQTINKFESIKFEKYLKLDTYANDKKYRDTIITLPGPPLEDSLLYRNPDISKEWDYKKNTPFIPSQFHSGSNKKMHWICKENHSWDASIKSRNRGRGCPQCAKSKTIINRRISLINKIGSFADNHPDLLEQWVQKLNINKNPTDYTSGSSEIIWWKCSKNHQWEAPIKERSNGHGCPFCAGRKISNDNNLAFLSPSLAKQWHSSKNKPLTPDRVVPGSARKVWWSCPNGHEWEAKIFYRSNLKNPLYCPTCKK